MPASPLSFEIDKRSVERAKKVLAKYQGAPLAVKLERGTLQAARMLVNPIRAVTPKGKTGNLRASVKAAQGRRSNAGLLGMRGAYVGPQGSKGAHRHLIVLGHRIVTPGGRDTGRRTAPFPFVDIGVRGKIEEARAIVSRILFA